MTENEIATIVVNTAFNIHTTLGCGLYESVYEEILEYELKKQGLFVERQKPIPVYWEDIKMEIGFRADLLIEDKVLVEIKSVETISPVHHKQVVTYLKIGGWKLGLLINFGTFLLKDGLQRIANKL